MDFLFSVLAFAVILIPAIIIHELGHFFAAKMVGINVLEFGVGFPPRAMRLFTWGETEFTLNWLPIGGFVRPLGEDMIGPSEETYVEAEYDEEGKLKHEAYSSEREELMARGVPREKLLSVNEAKPLSRIWFMAAGATFNIISAVIFFIITALFGLPIEQGARLILAEVPDNSVFAQANVSRGDAIELVNGEYFSTQAEFFALWNSSSSPLELTLRHPDAYENAELAGQRYTITVTPSPLNLSAYVLVSSVIEDSPAHTAGILPDDLIYSVNGETLNIDNPLAHLIDVTQESAGQVVELGIMRSGQSLSLGIIPRENPPRNQGRLGIGIVSRWQTSDGIAYENARPQIEYIPQPLDVAVSYSFNRLFLVLKMMWDLPGQLISGAISPEEARPVSVVGISQLGGQFLQDNLRSKSIWMMLDFIGLISIFLGITNLLPLPPLDGGRILFVILEILRGKPVSPKIESLVNQIGLYLFLGLGVIVILMDIFMPLV